MKTTLTAFLSVMLAVAATVAGPATAQTDATSAGTSSGSPTKTDRSIEYHGGPVRQGIQDVYFIAYGCWDTTGCSMVSQHDDLATLTILTDFMSTVGNTPYMWINSTYADAAGNPASSSLVYGGMVFDHSYAHGTTLTEADIQGIIEEQIIGFRLPHDPQGIYVVLTSSDVTLVDGAREFCLTCCNLHGHAMIFGAMTPYIFVGNPSGCPTGCGYIPNGSQTPTGNDSADVMASWLAHALNAVLTDPLENAWYDRYGLESAEKCEGTYGTVYTVTNPNGQPAFANVKLGTRHFLLQQNWVNGRKGHCALMP
jgi:hypothetical protein